MLGRNENYRTPNKALKAWDRASGYELSDGASDTDYENQALKDDDKNDLGESRKTLFLFIFMHTNISPFTSTIYLSN